MEPVQVFFDPVVAQIGPIALTESIITSLCVSAALIAVALFVRKQVLQQPDSLTAMVAFEGYRAIDDLVRDTVGRPSPSVTVFSGCMFLFVAACNISGQLPGVRPPTANVVVTSSLAVVVFLAAPFSGIATQGVWSYFKRYFQPNPFMAPLHVISELSRTLALSVRLFGNIMSGHLIVALLVALTGLFVPMPLMALDLLIGLLQAYIFALLSTVYVGAAIRSGEGA